MLTFKVSSNVADVRGQLARMKPSHRPDVLQRATNRIGREVVMALRDEMDRVFDRPTKWAKAGVRQNFASPQSPVFRVWIEEFGGKGTPPARFLGPQMEGGGRPHKRMELALQARGLMPKGAYAVPGAQAPLDAHGNVPGSFVVRMLSDLRAFGEQGYLANRKGKRRGARKSNYFFVPGRGSNLKPGVYWHLPNGFIGVVFLFVSKAAYEKRFDFYGVGQRAAARVAPRILDEEMKRIMRPS